MKVCKEGKIYRSIFHARRMHQRGREGMVKRNRKNMLEKRLRNIHTDIEGQWHSATPPLQYFMFL